MREILGRRRTTRWALRNAALTCATRWHWPVLPAVGVHPVPSAGPARRLRPRRSTPTTPGAAAATGLPASSATSTVCACRDPRCPVPGAHPGDPELLAATTDPRMVRWWWTNRPTAPLLLATGGRGVSALSLPATAGGRALAELDRQGVRTGPVVATPTRFALLVQPYDLAELGELLHAQDWVPSSLRFHGDGGYLVLPPSVTGSGRVRWERKPEETRGTVWLPTLHTLLEVLVTASAAEPDTGSRLAY